MKETYNYIDEHLQDYVDELLPFIAQPSISSTNVGMEESLDMLVKMMEEVGIETEVIPSKGAPYIYGQINVDPSKPRLIIYGHYDVVPAGSDKDWDTPPFEPDIRDNRIYARGSGDNKGQLFAHLKAIEAYKATKGEIPINITFIIDGEEEIGSPNMKELIDTRPDIFEGQAILVADASTLDQWSPVVFYGFRGLLYLELKSKFASSEWHAGSYGNLVPNPVLNLVHALSTMREKDGKILIDGYYDDVDPVSKVEREVMDKIPFNTQEKLDEIGISKFRGAPDVSYFEKMFYQPSLTIAGIVGGYTEEGPKGIVPDEALAKIDMCLVPGQDADDIYDKVQKHLIKNGFEDIEVKKLISTQPSKEEFDIKFGKIMAKSLKKVWGVDPIKYPSIGGGGPFSLFSAYANIPTLMVPYAQPDLHEHGPNESMHIDWFANGIKTTATLFEDFLEIE